MLNHNYLKEFKKDKLICFIIITFVFTLDRISKIKIIENQIDENQLYINDYLNLDLVWNTGIGFGLFSSNSNFFYNSITGLIGCIILFLIYLIFKSKLWDKILFSIIVGGALGNFYDRLVYYAVPDFIDVHYQRFHWFTFNIADMFITLGIIMLISKDLTRKNEKN
jgi:signal peptidase II